MTDYKNTGIRHNEILFMAVTLALLLVLSGCATPVGVRHLSPEQGYENLTVNVLSGGALSAETTQIINRFGLAELYDDEPEEVLAVVHNGLPTIKESDRLFALAELSFLHASEGGPKSYFLSAAIYAYAFLFPEKESAELDPLDPRLRIAAELYNQGIAKGFLNEKTGEVILQEGTYSLPLGDLTISIDPQEFIWGSFKLVHFTDASLLKIRGLRNQYRWPGLGAPLVASLERLPGVDDKAFKRVPQEIKVAATALLIRDKDKEAEGEGGIAARLELRTTTEGISAEIEGREIPLEFWLSAAIAETLEGSQVYKFALMGLLSGDIVLLKESARYTNNIYLLEPYQPGRIPLVLVHGTASSPARWAQLINEILNDRELWGRYQIWVFTYNTGNPIAYSAGIFTDALKKTVLELDPEGKDGALDNMVLVGHSQGGLLAKMAVVETETQFLDQIATASLEELDVSDETKKIILRSTVFKPLPFVRRVIFIATPHRGSFLSGYWGANLLSGVISLPATLLKSFQELISSDPDIAAKVTMKDIPKSIDDMNPESSFIQTLSSLKIADNVTVHSIIPVKNRKDPKEKWNDGVVRYESAHIDYAESELIVEAGHSAQEEPQTIEEVRRILIENMKETAGD